MNGVLLTPLGGKKDGTASFGRGNRIYALAAMSTTAHAAEASGRYRATWQVMDRDYQIRSQMLQTIEIFVMRPVLYPPVARPLTVRQRTRFSASMVHEEALSHGFVVVVHDGIE